jgi:quercetin dioxygenase-like cupin family protein
MTSEITGITRANEGMQGISWNILGQTYVPKNRTEHCFSWHATLPPGTFVPPHIHPDQDEYLYMLEGKLDFMLGGADAQATPGDLIRLGMGVPHGIFNKSDQTAKVLFWVSPTQKLYDLFWGIHNLKEQTPDAVVALAAEFNIHFLPPPPGRVKALAFPGCSAAKSGGTTSTTSNPGLRCAPSGLREYGNGNRDPACHRSRCGGGSHHRLAGIARDQRPGLSVVGDRTAGSDVAR